MEGNNLHVDKDQPPNKGLKLLGADTIRLAHTTNQSSEDEDAYVSYSNPEDWELYHNNFRLMPLLIL